MSRVTDSAFFAMSEGASSRRRPTGRRACVALLALLLVLGLALSACGGDDDGGDAAAGSAPSGEDIEPVTLRYSMHNRPDSLPHTMIQQFADRVAELSDGKLTIEIAVAQELLTADEVLAGVGDGRADLGRAVAAVFPAELPFSQAFGVPFVTADVESYSYAIRDLLETDALAEEFERLGLSPVLVDVVGPGVMISQGSLPTLESLNGKRIRGLGDLNEALELAGAAAVPLTGGEIYEAMDRNLVEAAVGVPMESFDEFHEVLTNMTDVGYGQYSATFTVMNKAVYDDLHPTLREAFDKAASEWIDMQMEGQIAYEQEGCDLLRREGKEIEVWSAEDQEAWAGLVGDRFKDKWVQLAADHSGRSTEEAEEFFAQYEQLLEQYSAESSYTPPLERCAESG